ncbi:MAG: prenyltransferase/squalene oxidase repeat-containing protein [Thermoguttaceae bacterium]|jgi:squalene-hopene/tetraprenyl-beta-curcumene cyclase
MLQETKLPRRFLPAIAAAMLAMAAAAVELPAADAGAPAAVAAGRVGPEAKTYQAVVDRAAAFLATRQGPDGSLSAGAGIGPTALATLGLLQNGRTAADPQVAKGLAWLESFVQKDGGIYKPGSFITNYETCVAVVCFQKANRQGQYDKILRRADAFLRGIQIDEKKGKDKSDPAYGGVGYGAKSRPDLSNTAFTMEALAACGAGPKDEAIQRALIFVSRCQNLEGPDNTTPYASKVNDGGLYYSCTPGRQEPDRQTANGGLRSEGSMTYSGLKSMIYAGLTRDDPRVKAAAGWIRKNYDLESNPGLGGAGLYYYYHVFAKALDAFGVDRIEDAKGVKHDWRRELTEELARRQQPNGSWVNADNRWLEGDPNLVTAYALLALSYCQPRAAK